MPDSVLQHGCSNEVCGQSCLYDPLAPTIFHEEWWLNVATDNSFEVAEVTAGGRMLGRLPYCVRKRFGHKMMHMPHLTYFLGPAVDEGEGSRNNRFLKRLEITRELIDKLPPGLSKYVKCHAGITDVIAFQERAFRTYVQFTHEVRPEPVEMIWQQMRNKTRNVIRRAEEQLFIREMTDPAEFLQLFEKNVALRGVQSELNITLCQKIIAASLERQRARILAACDKSKRVVAANVCVWDKTASYYLLSTRNSDAGNGASSLLIWQAMKDAIRRNLLFDFAGLGTQGSILFYTGFGAAVSPRYVAVCMEPLTRIAMAAKALFACESSFY